MLFPWKNWLVVLALTFLIKMASLILTSLMSLSLSSFVSGIASMNPDSRALERINSSWAIFSQSSGKNFFAIVMADPELFHKILVEFFDFSRRNIFCARLLRLLLGEWLSWLETKVTNKHVSLWYHSVTKYI